MIFTSIVFILFFFVVALLYYLLPGRFQWALLLVSGIYFYMYSNPVYILVPLLIILVTWFAGMQMEKSGSSRRTFQFYLFAIIVNVGLLVFFKYTNFFTSSAFDLINFTRNRVFHSGVVLNNTLLIDVIAPLGISYITFQAIGYLIEIKRGNHAAEPHLGHFSTYLLFFPKIIAGPVERAHHFLPQLKTVKTFEYDNVRNGLRQILWGMFKKLVIADRLSLYVSSVLDNAGFHSGVSLTLASIFYVFQMYADFSGYTDMALGFAKILGFDLMQNFNRPFFAKSVSEFWRKWHISLSTWFADYFYTPIAVAKRDWGKLSVVYAFFVTFIVLGFWHGPNWTFIIFGALQGFILTIEFFTRKTRKNIRKKIPEFLNSLVSMMFVFAYFGFSLIFFRAGTVPDALLIIKRIFTAGGPLYFDRDEPSSFIFSIMGVLMLMFVELK
ncbi:MAG: MBOAT family protein, partial [Bacteroidota bacterium]|nr:MBOAT family protein [Bacteroidota bacterium]